jgi:hypothetical protein
MSAQRPITALESGRAREAIMTWSARRRLALLLGVLVLAAAASAGPAVGTQAEARAATLTKVASTTATIPLNSIVIFRWTFTPPPTTAITARFQISADKRHWRTLKTLTIAAATRVVSTRWKAPERAETRFFRLRMPFVVSNVITVHVR